MVLLVLLAPVRHPALHAAENFSETAAQGTSNTHWRNNLILGENSSPAIFNVTTFTAYTSSDYNGFRPNPGAQFSFGWNTPKGGALADYAGPGHPAAFDAHQFATLEEYQRATGQDQHSVIVDYDVFVNVPRLDATDQTNVQTIYKAEDFDFQLKAASAAVDRGVLLSNVTDNFTGRPPDLGALERGRPVPHFGPRTAPTASKPSSR